MANQNDAVLEALSLAIAVRIPILLWGPPGAGKSSAVTAMCESAGFPYEVVIASIRGRRGGNVRSSSLGDSLS